MSKTAHLVCFRIGKETYGVDIFAVREIVKPQQITAVPGSSSYVRGIINLRGRIISVVDLAHRLGLGVSRLDRSSRILVVDLDEFTLGFLVDAATQVIKLEREAIDEAPEEHKRALHEDYLEGIGKLGDRLVIILNLRRLLSGDPADLVGAAGMMRAEGAK